MFFSFGPVCFPPQQTVQNRFEHVLNGSVIFVTIVVSIYQEFMSLPTLTRIHYLSLSLITRRRQSKFRHFTFVLEDVLQLNDDRVNYRFVSSKSKIWSSVRMVGLLVFVSRLGTMPTLFRPYLIRSASKFQGSCCRSGHTMALRNYELCSFRSTYDVCMCCQKNAPLFCLTMKLNGCLEGRDVNANDIT